LYGGCVAGASCQCNFQVLTGRNLQPHQHQQAVKPALSVQLRACGRGCKPCLVAGQHRCDICDEPHSAYSASREVIPCKAAWLAVVHQGHTAGGCWCCVG
jgi:hypothetical protein